MRPWWISCLIACSAPAVPPSSPTPQVPPETPGTPAAPEAQPAAPAAASPYPAAPRGDVVETLHGVAVADPYRWLEDMGSEATRAWVAAQNRLAGEHAARHALREPLRARMAELLANEKVGTPARRGQRYYWPYHDGRRGQPVMMSAPALDGAGTVVLDANQLSSDGSLAFAGFVAGERQYAAYGVARGGGDWTTWRIRDVAAGRDLPDELPHVKYYRPVFTRDGTGIYYSRFPAPKPGTELTATDRDHKVWFHKIGTPKGRDVVVYERPDQPTWQFQLSGTHDGRYLVISIGDGQVGDRGQEQIVYLDLDRPGAKPVPLIDRFDAEYVFAGSDGPVFYFKTTLDAPKKRVIAIDLRTPARERWRTIVPEGPLAINDVRIAGRQLFVSWLRDAHAAVAAYDLRGKKLRDVELPGVGQAWWSAGGPGDREAFYVFTNFTVPATVYRYDLATGKSTPWRAPKVAFDPAMFETRQVFFASKDGTRVPMFVTAKQGLPLDGKRPTVMTAYGFGGIPSLPYFDPTAIPWLERGGVSVLVNIRGGGEYGQEWHHAAKGTRRQTGVDDFIAAGEWLIANRYTSPAHLGITGASGGGMLVGMATVQRPELFGASVPFAGVLDLLRFHRFGQGAGWQGDLGSPDDPTEFAALHKLSPLHNVRPGTRYPPTLVITADTDVRVAPLHSYKYAAALQHAQADPAPILLRVETKSGHSGGVTMAQRIAQRADAMAFLAHHLGLP